MTIAEFIAGRWKQGGQVMELESSLSLPDHIYIAIGAALVKPELIHIAPGCYRLELADGSRLGFMVAIKEGMVTINCGVLND